MKRFVTFTLLAATAMPMVGCMNRPQRTGPARRSEESISKSIPTPPLPPGYSPAKPEALDHFLRHSATMAVAEAAKSQDRFIRAHAMEAAIYLPSKQARQIILDGVSDHESLVIFSSLISAGRLRLVEAREPALALVQSKDQNVRLAAVFALHRLGDKRFSRTLEQAATSSDPRIRGNTAMLLGMLEEPSAANVLSFMMKDKNPTVRLQVAEALWKINRDESALETLITATISRYPDDQVIAALALAQPGDPAVAEHLRGLLTTDYDEVNLAAARAMGLVGKDDGYGVVVRGARSRDARQRHLAALAFGAIKRRDAQSTLRELLRDLEPDVRLAAATAILQLK